MPAAGSAIVGIGDIPEAARCRGSTVVMVAVPPTVTTPAAAGWV